MKATFVLVHGAWQAAWCFAPLARLLQRAGHEVITFDLPAHGLNARFPGGYQLRGGERVQALRSERSPVASVALSHYVDAVADALSVARARSSGKVVLVGHSMGGLAVTAAAQAHPDRLDSLVYLAAFLPPPGMSAGACSASPQNDGALISKVALGNPAEVGSLRIDHGSDNAEYAERVKQAFAADLDEASWAAVAHLMTPDTPIQPLGTPMSYTADAWGTKPRLYIRCTEDYAVRPALQDFFIEQADGMTPENRFETVSLASGHMPFLSRTAKVADALDGFVAGRP